MPSAIKTHAAENARDIHARAQTAELLLGPAWLLCVWFLRKMTLGLLTSSGRSSCSCHPAVHKRTPVY